MAAGSRKGKLSRRIALLGAAAAVALGYVAWQVARNRDPSRRARRLGEEARVLRELGDLEAAKERVLQAQTLQPNDPAWAVELAQLRLLRGELTAAEALLREELGRSDDALVRLALAKLLLHTGRSRPARDLMERALTQVSELAEWKGRSEALRVAGLAQAGCGAVDRARALLEEASTVGGRGERVAALLELARVEMAFWNMAGGEDALSRAEALAPDAPGVALARVAFLRVSGESVQAEKRLRALYDLGEQTRRLVAQPLAELLVARGDLDQAGELASELDPYDEASATRVRMLIGMRRRDRSSLDAQAKRLTELLPESPDAHLTRARLSLRAGDLAQARRSYEEALRVAPGLASAEVGLLSLELRARDFSAVAARANGMLESPFTRASAVCALLTAARAGGQTAGTLLRLNELAQRFPDDGAIRAYTTIFRLLSDTPPSAEELERLAADRQLGRDLLRLASAESGSSEAIEGIELLGQVLDKEPRLSAVRLVLAQLYEGLGRRDLALREAEVALKTAPTLAARQYRARLALTSGDREEAKRQLLVCQAEAPSDSVAALLADLELQLGRPEAAAELLRDLALRRSDQAGFHGAYGRALARAGKIPEAFEAFEIARGARSRLASSHQAGALHLAQGQLEPAREAFARALEETGDPRFAAALAACHGLAGEAERGLQALAPWRISAPNSAEGIVVEATLLGLSGARGVGDPPPAIPAEVFRALAAQVKGSPLEPNRKLELEAFALWVVGWRKEAQERVGEALPGVKVDAPLLWWAIRLLGPTGDLGLSLSLGRQLNDAVREQPWVGLALADLEERTGEPEAALATLRVLRERFPAHPAVAMRLGQALDQRGVRDEALALYGELPDVPAALNNWAYLRGQDPAQRGEAVDAALKAVSKEPARGEYRDTLGWLLFQEGRKEEAFEHLSRATLLLPTQPSVRYHLALAFQDRGELDRAENNLRMALLLGEFPERAEAEAALKALDARGD